MPGTRAGAQKAVQRNLEHDPDHYRTIGSKSWANPERSRETGFATMPKDKHIELSRKGGKKTKDEYQHGPVVPREDETWATAEEIAALTADCDSL